jgi:hypothetical protein
MGSTVWPNELWELWHGNRDAEKVYHRKEGPVVTDPPELIEHMRSERGL